MISNQRNAGLAFAFALLSVGPLTAAEPQSPKDPPAAASGKPAEKDAKPAPPASSGRSLFKPRDNTGAPAPVEKRVRGGPYRGSQSTMQPGFQLALIALDDAGLAIGYTSRPNPRILWHTASVRDILTAVLRVQDNARATALPDVPLTLGAGPGLQPPSSTLPSLAPNVTYSLLLTVRTRGGENVEVSSAILYRPLAAAEQPAPDCARRQVCLATHFADLGYWFDAVDILAPNGQAPSDPEAFALWSGLLADAGLGLAEGP